MSAPADKPSENMDEITNDNLHELTMWEETSARILEEFFNCQLSCLVSNNRSEHSIR
jgi:hypothetical protein